MGIGLRVAQAALAVLAAVATAHAQPRPDDTRNANKDISGYSVEGRQLLAADEFTRIVAPFIGKKKSSGDIEAARGAVQRAYQESGRCTVRVMLAASEPVDGVVTFRVSETARSESRECRPATAQFAQLRVDRGMTGAPSTEANGSENLIRTGGDAALSPLPMKSAEPTPLTLVAATELKAASPLPGVRLAQAEPAQPTAPASPPPPDSGPAEPGAPPKFEIQRYQIEGNTLLRRERLDQVLAPYTGKNKDFGDVQRALEALQAAYQDEGYGGVEIRLPEQELERGEVRFVVIETKIARVMVEGNEHFSVANIRRSVPSLREGVTPHSRQIAESVRLANENPSKQATVLLRGAEREGEVDATIRVADIDPERWSVTLDNTGNENTGKARVGIAYQHSNVFDRDHVLTAQFITSPSQIKDVNVYGIGYKIPLYNLGDSVEAVAGYSNVDSGTVQNLFLVSGQGSIYGLRYNQALSRWRDLEQKLTYGLDYRAYQNQVTTDGSTGQPTLVPDITVHPISLTYNASYRVTGQDLNLYLSAAKNFPGGSDGQKDDFTQLGARPVGGTAKYMIYRAGINYVRVLTGDWQFRGNFSSQYTNDALVAPEQFGIGGADSVRGFNERYASNDKGYKTTLEIYTPDAAKSFGLTDGRLRFLVFYDTGSLRRNYAQPSESEQASLDSGGFGLRLSYKTSLTVRLDVAHVYHDGTGFVEPDSRRNIHKVHFSAAWVW